LLIVAVLPGGVPARRPDAGRDDEEAPSALAPDARDLERRGHDAFHAGLARQAGEPDHLVLDLVRDADPPEVALAEARQHGDGEDLRAPEALAPADTRHLGTRPL